MPNLLRDAALEYEGKGYSVIPLKPKDKIPLIPSWDEYQVERASREQIGEWWRTWPSANIGVITGAISGLFVIDCDSPKAAHDLKPMLGDMTDVGIAATGKGFHLYYSHGATNYSNKAAIKEHVDFRGDGGYIVAPPSVHPNGKTYEWAKAPNGHLRELPPEFIALMTADRSPAGIKARFDTAAALAGVPEGQRDDTLFRLACKLRGAGVPYEMAIELCEQAAANCNPPFREARAKVDRAYMYSPGHGDKKTANSPDQHAFWPMPISAREYNQKNFQLADWIWKDTCATSQIAMIAGQPRAGKSTLALNLAMAIARGGTFLDRETLKSRVLYVNLDNPDPDFVIIKNSLGLRDEDDVFIYSGPLPTGDSAGWLEHVMTAIEAKIVIIDTFVKFHPMENINDNSEAERLMLPVMRLVADKKYFLTYVHHMGKGEGANLTGFMGAMAIKANCQQYMQLTKVHDKYRILTSDFRNGKPFDRAYLKVDAHSGWNMIAGSIDDAETELYQPRILEYLAEHPERVTETEIKTAVDCNKPRLVSIALRTLEKAGEVNRIPGNNPKGKKVNLWGLAEALFAESQKNRFT